MILVINPFGGIVVNILKHTSVKWFCHGSWETSDIVISVPAVPAVLTACSSEWHWHFPLIYCPNDQALKSACS